MIIDVDGQKFDVPDDASPDEIDGLTRPVQQLSNPRAQAESVLATMGPVEQTLAAIGGGMYRGGRQVGNLLGKVGVPGMPTDEEMREEAEIQAPLAEKNKIATFVGDIAPQIPLIMATGGGSAVARAGILPRLANIGKQAAAGAGQGYVFSGPDDRGTNAALGGVVGGGIGAVANPLAALARRALDRADEGAYKLFEPSIEKLKELAEKGRRPGQTAEQGMRNFGRQIREAVDPQTGKRLVGPAQEIGERELAVGRVGEQGGKQIGQALRTMDDLGLKGRPAQVRQQLIQARDELLGTGDVATFTPTQRRSLMAINRQIDDFDRVFGTKMELDPIVGMKPAETKPLTMAEHPETGALVRNADGDRILAESRVGSTDELWRSTTPPPEGFQQSRYGRPGTEAARMEPSTRGQPLKRNQYLPDEEVLPERPGIVGMRARLEDLPLSTFEEKAKRLLGKEGFQKAGSNRYRTADVAEGDPAIQWLRRATGILKGHTEEQFAPKYFLEGKKMAALDEILGPAAKDAAVRKAGRTLGVGGSPQGTLYRRMVDAAGRHARPYGIKTNEMIDAVSKALPHNTDAALRAAVIEMLRKETENAP